jgi:hypothetical protein
MSFFWYRGRKAPYLSASEIWPDVAGIGEARRAELAFMLYEIGRASPRRASRATLPDVDFSLAVRQARRPLLERLFGAPRALKKHHKPSSRAV